MYANVKKRLDDMVLASDVRDEIDVVIGEQPTVQCLYVHVTQIYDELERMLIPEAQLEALTREMWIFKTPKPFMMQLRNKTSADMFADAHPPTLTPAAPVASPHDMYLAPGAQPVIPAFTERSFKAQLEERRIIEAEFDAMYERGKDEDAREREEDAAARTAAKKLSRVLREDEADESDADMSLADESEAASPKPRKKRARKIDTVPKKTSGRKRRVHPVRPSSDEEVDEEDIVAAPAKRRLRKVISDDDSDSGTPTAPAPTTAATNQSDDDLWGEGNDVDNHTHLTDDE